MTIVVVPQVSVQVSPLFVPRFIFTVGTMLAKGSVVLQPVHRGAVKVVLKDGLSFTVTVIVFDVIGTVGCVVVIL